MTPEPQNRLESSEKETTKDGNWENSKVNSLCRCSSTL